MMTTIQRARARTFASHLRFRGVCFVTDGTPATEFNGVRTFSPQTLDEFTVGPADRTDGQIHVLREDPDPVSPLRPFDYYALNIVEGSILTNKNDLNEQWKVAVIEDNPVNVVIILHVNQEQLS
jgi:hypothetical protein